MKKCALSPPSDVCARGPLSHAPAQGKTLRPTCEAGETQKIGKISLCPSEEDPCPVAGKGEGAWRSAKREQAEAQALLATFANAAARLLLWQPHSFPLQEPLNG